MNHPISHVITDNRFRDILNNFGLTSQRIKAKEELAELIVSISKDSYLDVNTFGFHQKRVHVSDETKQSVIEEIADVYIMLVQLSLVYGVSNIEQKIEDKLNRTIYRIQSEPHHNS